MDAAIALANRVAPEHLEVLMREPWSVLPRIRHAGAVFLGPYAPGPAATTSPGPTTCCPRSARPLLLGPFPYRLLQSAPASSRPAAFAARNADAVARLARMEQLEAHARSMECRKQ